MNAPCTVESLVREIVVLDKSHCKAIESHLLSLNSEDQYLRFSSLVTPQRVKDYCSSINFDTDLVTGQFDGARLVGLCHVGVDAVKIGLLGELGVSVDANFRGQGCGKMLVADAVRKAKDLGVNDLQIDFLAKNTRMRAIASRLGAKIRVEDSDCTSTLCLNPSPEQSSSGFRYRIS